MQWGTSADSVTAKVTNVQSSKSETKIGTVLFPQRCSGGGKDFSLHVTSIPASSLPVCQTSCEVDFMISRRGGKGNSKKASSLFSSLSPQVVKGCQGPVHRDLRGAGQWVVGRPWRLGVPLAQVQCSVLGRGGAGGGGGAVWGMGGTGGTQSSERSVYV